MRGREVEGEPGVRDRDQMSGSKTGDLSYAKRLQFSSVAQ